MPDEKVALRFGTSHLLEKPLMLITKTASSEILI